MEGYSNVNLVTSLAALVFGGAVSFTIARMSKNSDARGAAEAALIGIGPAIITEQNRRIEILNKEVARLWSEWRKAIEREQECRRRLDALEQRNKDRDERRI